MQVTHWTPPGSDIFIRIDVNGAPGGVQCTTCACKRRLWSSWWVWIREQRRFCCNHIFNPAFLLVIVLGGTFHAFKILSKWPEGAWPRYILACGVIFLNVMVMDVPEFVPFFGYLPPACAYVPVTIQTVAMKELPCCLLTGCCQNTGKSDLSSLSSSSISFVSLRVCKPFQVLEAVFCEINSLMSHFQKTQFSALCLSNMRGNVSLGIR